MALVSVASWITGRFKKQSQNEVTPIEIIVQPRQHERHPDIGCTMDDQISVFAIQDEVQFARLWYSNDNCNVSAAAIRNETRPTENKKNESIKMSKLSFQLTLDDRPVTHTNDLTGTSKYSRLQPSQIMSPQQRLAHSIRSFGQHIWSSVIHAKTVISEALRRTQRKSYISSYLSMMYMFGISAIHTNTNQPNNVAGRHKWLRLIAVKVQLAIFVLFAFLSAFQSFCQAKYDVLWFLFKGGLNQFIKFSFHVTCLVSSTYCSYCLCREWDAMKKMADAMISYQTTWASATKHPVICVVLATITALLASLRSLLIINIKDFSVENAMLESSYQMSEDLFLWSSKNLNLSIQKLDEEFGNDLNSTEIIFAIIRVFRDFAYFLQDGMFWDLIGCVVFTMHCWMKIFMGHVTEVVDNVVDETSEEWRVLQQKREQVWRMYVGIRVVFEAVNNVFNPLLVLYHVTNVLRYAFFMEIVIYPADENSLTYVHFLYNILKSEITYVVASRIAQQNKVIRKWLRNWGLRTGKINVDRAEMDMNAVLDELNDEPLGLGKGDFIIDQGFHFGLLGLVSSLFVMLASKKQ